MRAKIMPVLIKNRWHSVYCIIERSIEYVMNLRKLTNMKYNRWLQDLYTYIIHFEYTGLNK